jgi:hypothetical protein
MSESFLWDGENRRGPMDRTELDNCVRFHPNPGAVRVWRLGFSDWKPVEEAFDLAGTRAPHRRGNRSIETLSLDTGAESFRFGFPILP